jgi:hypothetical protein
VRSLAAKLTAGQLASGTWGYSVPVLTREQERDRTIRKPPQVQIGDLSVSQFAVLALWQAGQVGAKVDEPLRKVRQRLAWGQSANGGWSYRGVPSEGDSATMTAAGAYMWVVASASDLQEARRRNQDKVSPIAPKPRAPSTLAKLRDQLAAETRTEEQGKIRKKLEETKDPPPSDVYDAIERSVISYVESQQNSATMTAEQREKLLAKVPDTLPPELDAKSPAPLVTDPALKKALDRVGFWADRSITGSDTYHFYYVWSVERLGVLLGRDVFGKTVWFDKGADDLIAKQKPDGSWGMPQDQPGGQESHYKYGPDICFALLFLKKANLGSEVTKLLNPSPNKPFVIANRTDSRHESLDKALAAAQPNDTIIVESDGPFRTGGLVIDKPVTIRAAQGYDPVFRYERPKDRSGFEVDLKAQPQAKNLLVITAKPVMLEGLRLQFEPPIGIEAEWTAIRCSGDADVRLLNCTLSQVGRIAVAGIAADNVPRVFLRNTMLSGFDPALRIGTEKVSNLMVKDCVIYAPTALAAAGAGEINAFCYESTIQAGKAIDLGDAKGSVNVVAENNVFKAEQLVARLGSAGTTGRTWDGRQENLFDVRQWIAGGDARASAVDDLASWKKFWNAEEYGSQQMLAPFIVSRLQMGSFRHEMSPQEWGLDSDRLANSPIARAHDNLGANVYLVGAGAPYVQFRESLDYRNWFRVVAPSDRKEAEN